LQIASAQDVLMTLWPLNDPLARAFMDDFYRAWLGAAEPIGLFESLRKTQLDWIGDKDARKRDPKYWAPFVLVERGPVAAQAAPAGGGNRNEDGVRASRLPSPGWSAAPSEAPSQPVDLDPAVKPRKTRIRGMICAFCEVRRTDDRASAQGSR
jgi:hypothetical protein